ncbi:MAG: peptidase M48, partial [Gammaproteobacteria bacterium]|nr:peptidase M48 [Gammaproteobacteria bacterium]
ASKALVRLDLPDNPGQYLQTRLQVDAQGQVGVAVGNASPVAVRNIEIIVGVLDPSGTQVQQTKPFQVSNVVGPGQQILINTGLGPVTEQAQLQRIKVQVTGAVLAE